MESELKKKFDVLLKLQENEIETATVQSMLDKLPGEMAALDAKAKTSEKIVSDVTEHLSELQQMFRAQESEAKSVQSSITKSEDKLRAVKTNKEYQSSLKEIEDLGASLSAIEDRMIACLEEIDEKETTLIKNRDELQRIFREIESEKEHISKSADSLQQRIDGLFEARGHVIAATDPDLLKLYQTVKENIGSTAIALVKSAVCMGCHVNLPPQMFNELLRFDKVFYCPHCERLIYPLADSTDGSKEKTT
jgi:hypothetical protein